MIIIIIILFLLQIVSFYIIALLYMKMGKLNDVEKKQRKLMDEMEESIAAYLTELKDENDRFLQQFSMEQKKDHSSQQSNIGKAVDIVSHTEQVLFEQPKIPVRKAIHTYQKNSGTLTTKVNSKEETETASIRTKVSQLAAEGYSIEEIAKQVGVGKTEIELMLKFGF